MLSQIETASRGLSQIVTALDDAAICNIISTGSESSGTFSTPNPYEGMKKTHPLPVALPLIRVIRGQRVILDFDLARLYGVSTSQLNQQFRRNRRRFPRDFAFILTRKEAGGRLQNATTLGGRNRNKPPIAYTEHGAVMAANVLKSSRAVAMSVEVVRAFVQLRKIASSHGRIERILAELEIAVVARLNRHDKEIEALFELLGALIGEDVERPAGVRRVGSA